MNKGRCLVVCMTEEDNIYYLYICIYVSTARPTSCQPIRTMAGKTDMARRECGQKGLWISWEKLNCSLQ